MTSGPTAPSSAPALPPPAREVLDAMRAAAASPPRDLAELRRTYAQLAPRPVYEPGPGELQSLTALEALCAREPGFTARLFDRIVPAVLRAAAAYPRGVAVPLLVAGRAGRVVLPRTLVASIVAHMVFDTLGEPPGHQEARRRATFGHLLLRPESNKLAKLRCMLAYFDRLAGDAGSGPRVLPGRLTIERDVLRLPARGVAQWASDSSELAAFELAPEGGVEDSPDALQVDFANRRLGGAVLSHGCVQEEIRFSVCPELLAAMPLCDTLEDHEAIRLHGAERFANVTGYAADLAYAGDAHDSCPRLADGTPDVTLLAIDALDLRRVERGPAVQFEPEMLLRELNKAYVGFGGARPRPAHPVTIATGHWGCGAFRGHHALKAVQQWLAASAVGAALRYHTYGDARGGDLAGFTTAARARFGAVGPLWQRLRAVVPAGPPAGADPAGPWVLDALLA